MTRVTDPRQQGSRLGWADSLFEALPIHFEPAPEPIPVGEATELHLPALTEASLAAPHCGHAMPARVCALSYSVRWATKGAAWSN